MNFPLVKVLWDDARTECSAINLNELKNGYLAPIETIGYKVFENEKLIAVCGFVHPSPDINNYDDGFRYIHYIPIAWIKKIILLKEVKL